MEKEKYALLENVYLMLDKGTWGDSKRELKVCTGMQIYKFGIARV